MLLGIKKDDETAFADYIVVDIEKKQISEHSSYCWVEIEGTHNFVASNLIVHNNDSIKISVDFF
jgi:intein/homing endonuclease